MFADLHDLIDNLPAHVSADNVVQAILVAVALTAIVLVINAGHFAAKSLWRGAELVAAAFRSVSPGSEDHAAAPEKPLSDRCRQLLRLVTDHRHWTPDSTVNRGPTGVYVYDSPGSGTTPDIRLMAGLSRDSDGSPWLQSHAKGRVLIVDLLEGLTVDEYNTVVDELDRMIKVVDENARRAAIGMEPFFPDDIFLPDEPKFAQWRTVNGDPIDLNKFCQVVRDHNAKQDGWGYSKTTTTIEVDGKKVTGNEAAKVAAEIRGKVEEMQKDVQEMIRKFTS